MNTAYLIMQELDVSKTFFHLLHYLESHQPSFLIKRLLHAILLIHATFESKKTLCMCLYDCFKTNLGLIFHWSMSVRLEGNNTNNLNSEPKWHNRWFLKSLALRMLLTVVPGQKKYLILSYVCPES